MLDISVLVHYENVTMHAIKFKVSRTWRWDCDFFDMLCSNETKGLGFSFCQERIESNGQGSM